MKIAIGLVGLLGVVNLAFWIKDHRNAVDIATTLSPYVATQNNLYPNGKFTNVGTYVATPNKKYPKTAVQGGDSAVTNSTGRWAA